MSNQLEQLERLEARLRELGAPDFRRVARSLAAVSRKAAALRAAERRREAHVQTYAQRERGTLIAWRTRREELDAAAAEARRALDAELAVLGLVLGAPLEV